MPQVGMVPCSWRSLSKLESLQPPYFKRNSFSLNCCIFFTMKNRRIEAHTQAYLKGLWKGVRLMWISFWVIIWYKYISTIPWEFFVYNRVPFAKHMVNSSEYVNFVKFKYLFWSWKDKMAIFQPNWVNYTENAVFTSTIWWWKNPLLATSAVLQLWPYPRQSGQKQ